MHTLTHNVTSLWSSFVCTRHSPQQGIEKPLNIVPEINKIMTININTHLIEEILNDESSNYILSQNRLLKTKLIFYILFLIWNNNIKWTTRTDILAIY